MSVKAMERQFRTASPLGYFSDGSVSASSTENDPPTKQRTQTYIARSPTTAAATTTVTATTHTPPARCSTLGPESVTQPSHSSPDANTTEEDEEAGINSTIDNNTETEDEDDRPLPQSVTRTLPLLSDLGAALSSSMISSHDTSFCNSLMVNQGEVTSRLPLLDPHHTPTAAAYTQQEQQQYGGNSNHYADTRNVISSVEGVLEGKSATSAAVGGGNKDAGLASLEGGATTSSASTGVHSLPTTAPSPPSLSNPNDLAAAQQPQRSRHASFSNMSPTASGLRQRRGLASPAGDVRTLHDLLAWRSHLSDSQRSGDTHRESRDDDSSGGGGGVNTASCNGSPFSKSVPTPPPVRAIETNMVFHFPASTPVTPGLWYPTIPVAETHINNPDSTSTSTSSHTNHNHEHHQMHAPPFLASLVGHESVSQLSATAAPRSRNGSREALGAPRTCGSPCNASSPVSAHSPTQRLASNHFSRSELGDSSASSTATSHLASPASALPPLHHPHPVSSPCEAKPHCAEGGGFAPSTPVTTRATKVLDTRHAAQEKGSEGCQHHSHHSSHSGHHHHSDTRGSGSNAASHPAASPASSSSLSGVWGVEDYAPAHTRSSAGAHHLGGPTAAFPFRHHSVTSGQASRCSEPAMSPRGELPALLATGGAADFVYGSPVCAGHSALTPWGTAGPLHRTPSSALSTPHQLGERGVRDAARQWRGLQAPEEYPAFATPVDEDTNKAVVAFVTALLLLFCLGFIFAV